MKGLKRGERGGAEEQWVGVSAGTAFPGCSAFGAHPGGESSGAAQVELLLGDQVPPPPWPAWGQGQGVTGGLIYISAKRPTLLFAV